MENVKRLYTRGFKKGNENPRWNGGVSEYDDHYQMKLNRIEKMKQTKGKCEVCGEDGKQIHHIDESKTNHKISNLIILCKKHHSLIHTGRVNRNSTSKYIRKYGMNLDEMSNKLNMAPSTIIKILKGNNKNISKEQILKRLGIVENEKSN